MSKLLISTKTEEDVEFENSFGFALGHYFCYLPDELQKRIFSQIANNTNRGFASGLGEGLGHNFPWLSSQDNYPFSICIFYCKIR